MTYPMTRGSGRLGPAKRKRAALTLFELVVAVTIMAVVARFAVPSFRRTLERARVEQAAGNLRAIWSAEQLYWLKNRTYAAQLSDLQQQNMIDSSLTTTTGAFAYSILSASSTTFTARAVRQGSTLWTGTLAVTDSGIVSGSIQSAGLPAIIPSP